MSESQPGRHAELGSGKIFVAGHPGMVGAALLRRLAAAGCDDLVLRSHQQLDLARQEEVEGFFRSQRPAFVFLAAAKVGGIAANQTFPADFIYENLMIAANVIRAACDSGVRRLLYLGSSCIYPRLAPQPMSEAALLTGTLEPTNEPYAIAKIAGIKLCESFNRQHGTDFRSVMPTNLYGPHDNFDLASSHVVPALIRKFHEAKLARLPAVEVWGTGNPRREFLHVDDLAEACLFVMNLSKPEYDSATLPMRSHINVGTGEDITIRELAGLVREVVGFGGRIVFNPAYPDGTPRKLLDVTKLTTMGWRPTVSLRDGLAATYEWYRQAAGRTCQPPSTADT